MDGDRMQALLKAMLKDKAIKEIADRYVMKYLVKKIDCQLIIFRSDMLIKV